MTRSHGVVRGLQNVSRSSLEGTRFGRMFRWLPGETYSAADLNELAKVIIQRETADFRAPGDIMTPPVEPVLEGPDVVFKTIPMPPPDAGKLLDTVYGDPEPADENPTIPAGYTYFGQFIDHDLTFDPNSSLQKQNDPNATEDFRTPRFDLDSLYGRGPDDQPYLYKDAQEDGGGNRFLLGRTSNSPPRERLGELPRNVEGRALTGDPRNDENGIICQLQVVFLNFHNKVVDFLHTAHPLMTNHELFLNAQRIVRWHYQYLVLNDYLPRVVGEATWKAVFQGSGKDRPEPHLRIYRPKHGEAYMPVEFSVAGFRFGHSMVRPSYALRAADAKVGGDPSVPFSGDDRFHRIPIFSDRGRGASPPGVDVSLDGFGPLPKDWEIDWNLFFCVGDMPTELSTVAPDVGVRQVKPQAAGNLTQPGYRIDTQLVDPLAMLPPNVAKSGNMPDGIPALAFRNLLRGNAFELPSGQNVARALGYTALTETELWGNYTGGPGVRAFNDPKSNPFNLNAPLWFYILKEAELTKKKNVTDGKGGHHLGKVGGHIVAEVLVGIAVNDHTSYLVQDPKWTPAAEKAKSGFDAGEKLDTVFGLIHWTTGGAMHF